MSEGTVIFSISPGGDIEVHDRVIGRSALLREALAPASGEGVAVRHNGGPAEMSWMSFSVDGMEVVRIDLDTVLVNGEVTTDGDRIIVALEQWAETTLSELA